MAKSKRTNKKSTLSTLAITATTLGVLIGQNNDQLPASKINLQNILNDKSNPEQIELTIPEKIKFSNDDVTSSISEYDSSLLVTLKLNVADKAIKNLEALASTPEYRVVSEYEVKKLEYKHQYLALVSAAKEFGNLLPVNYQGLQEKVQYSLITIGEESKSDDVALERIIIFCGDLTNDLHKMYNQIEESESVILLGVRFNVRLLTFAINTQVKGIEELVEDILSNEVGTLMAIFQTLFALYELVKNVKKEKNRHIRPKSEEEVNVMHQAVLDSRRLNLWVIEAATDRLRKLTIELCKMVEDCTDPEIEYQNIYKKYQKKICAFIRAIRNTNQGNLPDAQDILRAWMEFGCETIPYPTRRTRR